MWILDIRNAIFFPSKSIISIHILFSSKRISLFKVSWCLELSKSELLLSNTFLIQKNIFFIKHLLECNKCHLESMIQDFTLIIVFLTQANGYLKNRFIWIKQIFFSVWGNRWIVDLWLRKRALVLRNRIRRRKKTRLTRLLVVSSILGPMGICNLGLGRSRETQERGEWRNCEWKSRWACTALLLRCWRARTT